MCQQYIFVTNVSISIGLHYQRHAGQFRCQMQETAAFSLQVFSACELLQNSIYHLDIFYIHIDPNIMLGNLYQRVCRQ